MFRVENTGFVEPHIAQVGAARLRKGGVRRGFKLHKRKKKDLACIR